jgi:hypothetical protein
MADDFNDNPGPGAYCIKYKLKYDQAPVYTIAARLREASEDAAGLPGPGTYSPQLFGKGPCYSLPARLKGLATKDNNPGPGTYSSHTRYTQTRPPSYSIAARLAVSRSGKNPGPGAYDPKLQHGGPSFSLRTRNTECARDKNPGPGAYHPHVHNCIPAYSLGKRLDGKGGDETPGPGAYNTLGKRCGPAYTMRGRFDRKRPPGRNTK